MRTIKKDEDAITILEIVRSDLYSLSHFHREKYTIYELVQMEHAEQCLQKAIDSANKRDDFVEELS